MRGSHPQDGELISTPRTATLATNPCEATKFKAPPFRMCADRATFTLIIIGNDLKNLTDAERKSLT